jgi:hypothetical protein
MLRRNAVDASYDGSSNPESELVGAKTHREADCSGLGRGDVLVSHGSAEASFVGFHDDEPRAQRGRADICSTDSTGTIARRRLATDEDLSNSLDKDKALNTAAWDIINGEIAEWREAHYSGRPRWWSSTSKGRQSTQSQYDGDNSYGGVNELDNGFARFNTKEWYRQAASDSCLQNYSTVEDLAQLIAVQLLGACFTLPLGSATGSTFPAFHEHETLLPYELQDPQLISSLRMHTHFHYSPSFGHQARNTSPAHLSADVFDGPSEICSPSSRRCPSDRTSSHFCSGSSISTSGSPTLTSDQNTRQRHFHRALHVTEESESNCASRDHAAYNRRLSASHEDLPLTDNTTTRYHPKGVRNSERNKIKSSRLPGRPSLSNPVTTNGYKSVSITRPHPSGSQTSATSPSLALSPSELKNFARPWSGLRRGKDSWQSSPTKHYSLQPTIRSEPHRLFVQPVRELVVKRWHTFRDRLGQTRGSDSTHTARDFMQMASPSRASSRSYLLSPRLWRSRLSSFSTGRSSGYRSPVMSSDGEERRRRARERGEIHSESWESSPICTTPISSGYLSPGLLAHESPEVMSENASGFLSLGAHTDIINSRPETPFYPTPESSINLSPASNSPGLPSTPFGTTYLAPLERESNMKSAERYGPRYSLDAKNRGRRRTMLSEVTTPDNLSGIEENQSKTLERNLLSAMGSALPSPSTERYGPFFEGMPVAGSRDPFTTLQRTTSSPGPDWNVGPSLVDDVSHRLRLQRTSTSGTQVWTPNEDGIEVDGLPVGPAMEDTKWTGQRERSFL